MGARTIKHRDEPEFPVNGGPAQASSFMKIQNRYKQQNCPDESEGSGCCSKSYSCRISRQVNEKGNTMKKNTGIISVYLLVLMLILSVSTAALADELIFPSSLTTIEAEAFMGDTSLDSVVIPSGVTAIKARTFADSSLQSITIPSSVRSVAADAFSGTYPDIYVEDINSLSGNLTGTVYLTRNSTISSAISYSEATLVVNEGVTLTITGDGTLEGTDLAIYGTVINRGTLVVSEEITTSGAGLLSVQNTNTVTELPHNSFYGGLKFSLAEGVQVLITDEDGNSKTVTVIGIGSHTADVTTPGEHVRFCFIPSESGSYTIYSTDTVDTYGYLLDASGNVITYDDDSGDNRNFSLSYDLTAGTVYFYDVRYYDSDLTGTIPFILMGGSCDSIDFTSQPSNVIATSNGTVSFSVTAGEGATSYQWQMKSPISDNWQNVTLSGYNTPTLTLTASQDYDNYSFRCAVTNPCGTPTYSETAKLFFVRGTIQLGSSSVVISSGGQVARYRFVPSVSGEYTLISTGTADTKGYLYDASMTQLAYSDDAADSNFNVTYELTANTVYYYGVAYYNNSDTGTIPVILSSDIGPKFTLQPSDATVTEGNTVSFSVTATGTGTLSYQWQELANGSSNWQNSSKSGYNTNTLSFTAQTSQSNTKFRCIVTDGSGLSNVSNEALLIVRANSSHDYRALLIAETNFEGSQYRPGHHVAVENINEVLQSIAGPDGGQYEIYGGNNEYEDASPTRILSLIQTCFGNATDDDVSLFFINSHGDSGSTGLFAGAIETVDQDPNHRYYVSSGGYYELPDCLLVTELANALAAIPGKVIIWIDTCGSGAGVYASDDSSGRTEFDSEKFNQEVIQAFAAADEGLWEISEETGELRRSNKFYVITASAYQESSYSDHTNGDFLSQAIKYALLNEGEYLPADTNNDGVVTQHELYTYAYDWLIDVLDDEQHAQVYPTNSSYQLFTK